MLTRKFITLILLTFTFTGEISDIDGNIYNTIEIGNQVWMVENLKTQHFKNGDEISYSTDPNEAAYLIYDDDVQNENIYGKLYNVEAVHDDRGLCMEGWHVPSDEEWKELELYSGMTIEEVNNWGFRGDIAYKLVGQCDLWSDDGYSGYNCDEIGEIGLELLPGGNYNNTWGDEFDGLNETAEFHTSSYSLDYSENSNGPITRVIYSGYSEIVRTINSGANHFISVRCIKDEDIEGCTDEVACNYDENASIDDGSCTYAEENFDCDGNCLLDIDCEDVCGGDAVIDDCGVCNGDGLSCATISDIDGNEYGIVSIDGKIWMSENLKVTRFNNGDPVDWDTCTEYGYLYNRSAISQTQNICPENWRVANNQDYQYFIDYTGDWMTAGTAMKDEDWGGTNEHGFSAQPGSWKYDSDSNQNCGNGGTAYIWTDDEYAVNLDSGTGLSLVDYVGNDNLKFSIRCVEIQDSDYGCNDEYACNYDENVVFDDGSCNYSCHDNGDYALYLNGTGNAQVDITDLSFKTIDFNALDSFSIFMNIESDGTWDDNPTQIFFSLDGCTNMGGPLIRIGLEEAHLTFGTTVDGLYDYVDVAQTDWGAESDSWKQLIFVWDGEYASIFKDGEKIATTNGGNEGPLETCTNGYLTIGSNDGNNPLKGMIDNVAVLDFDVTSRYGYYDLSDYDADDFVAYWKFNQGQDGEYPEVLIDHSGNDFHGIIQGADWTSNTEGCTDSGACNYDENATLDDGSCIFFEGNTRYVATDGANENCGLEDYPLATIEAAMSFSDNGDTIRVASGEYNERMFITKSLSIIGEDSENTIIDTNGTDSCVDIRNVNDVHVSNFTFRDGDDPSGGGAYIYNSIVSFDNCIFTENNATDTGAGLYANAPGTAIELTNCTFNQNIAGQSGGAICVTDDTSISIDQCTFNANSAVIGGAIDNYSAESMIITNSVFSENNVTNIGGAIWIDDTDIQIKRCVFNNNHADNVGSVIHAKHSNVDIDNTTIACNTASYNNGNTSDGSTMFIYDNSDHSFSMSNSISQFNMGGDWDIYIQHDDADDDYEFLYNNCQDDICTSNDESNSGFDPDFVAQNNCIEPDLNLNFTSDCIDAGDPNSDLDPDGTRADMGGLYYDQLANPLPDPQVALTIDSDSVSVNNNSFEVPVNYQIGDWYDEGLEFYSFYMKVNIDSLLTNVVATTDLDITMEQNFNSTTNNLIIAGASSSPLDELGTLLTLTIEDSDDNWEVGSVFDISITDAYFDVDEYDTILDDCQISIVAFGCTDNTACNYNGSSDDGWVDDGSCTFPSDDGQGNYGGNTTDGTSEIFDCEGSCLVDSDCLGVCGGDAVIDECGVCDGEGVDADGDGNCDDVDDCVSTGGEHLVYDQDGNEVEDPNFGGYDECGLCNGPGPEFECSEDELACEISSCTLTLGDVDENGLIQPFDASYILQYLTENELLDPELDLGYYNADVNETGDISAYDATVVLKYIVELIDELPCPDCIEEAQGLVDLFNLEVEGSSDINLPINLSDAENIYSFELEFSYDVEKVDFSDIDWPEGRLGFLTQHRAVDGILKVTGATGMSPINQEDLLGTLIFTQIDDFTDTEICLSMMKFNDNEPIYDRGCSLIESVLSVEDMITEYSLNGSYPNPFNPATTISYDVPDISTVNISVYNTNGQLLDVITNSLHEPGRHTVVWDGANYSSGIYIIRMRSDKFIQSHKVMLVK